MLAPSGNVRDALFAFDVDKFAHVVVFADDLDGYKAARPHAATDSTAQMRRISERMRTRPAALWAHLTRRAKFFTWCSWCRSGAQCMRTSPSLKARGGQFSC